MRCVRHGGAGARCGGVRAARLFCAPVPATGAAAQARKDEARGMALGRSIRTHAPKAPVASRLLPASYLFPKPEPVRIGGSSWGILSLVAQHQTPHGNIESGVRVLSLNKCDAQAVSQSPNLIDVKMIRALENPKATRAHTPARLQCGTAGTCSLTCMALLEKARGGSN